MNKEERILERTKNFSLRSINLYTALPDNAEAQILGKQVLRSGTSVGAQLREGKRSRSDAEMISKIEGASQELKEPVYWLELIAESEIMNSERLTDLMNETDELIAILVTRIKTLKSD